uniref:Uncharacterized protein n=1 Tax=Arcella intermedia TaxID=1963864 RepID=A0A6B2LMR4_9EUKA
MKEKADLYEQFVKGGNLDPKELEKKGFLVDFEQKNWDDQEPEENNNFFHEDIERENQRLRWEKETKEAIEQEEKMKEKKREERIALNLIIVESQKGREKLLQAQESKKKQAQARKEMIKQRALQKKTKLESQIEEQKQQEQQLLQQQKEDKNKKRLHMKINS